MSPPNRESYTVGWVCAVQTEYVAARCFFDEEHGKLDSVHTNDNNHYTLGNIGGHNVVIAVLPNGEYGISSATAVVKDMLHSFSNIRIGLMVGIGGGAPSRKHDIRLGDIVVGTPRNGNGGVFQYDFGKTRQDQDHSFQYTGFLNQPPVILRTALTGLATRHEIDGHNLEKAINDILDKKPRLRKKYKRPDPTCDRLYKSAVVHTSKEEGCAVACGDELVSRPERTEEEDNPAIHYGLIASANQLMKNATIRDKLAAEKDILCFEMEAAGLVNQLPCLVIRGICDYSNSHKNNEWQGYAAMAAAAYAKELLYEVIPSKIESEGRIAEIPGILSSIERNINDMHINVQDTKDDVKHIKNKIRKVEIDKWLSAPDPSTNYNKAIEQCHEGSGTWFLESKQFTEWKTQQRSFLWLRGIPGCGKTILSSTIIQKLENDLTHQPLLYFYFDFNDTGKQTLDNMLRALISQLYYKCEKTSIYTQLETLFSSCAAGYQQPTCRSLHETFLRMIGQAKEVWLVLDALDECRTRSGPSTEGLLSWMKEVLNSGQSNVHLVVTSRAESDIDAGIMDFTCIDNVVRIESSLIANDINAYIRTRVRKENGGLKRWRSHPEVQSEIENCLIEKANGMFRWAACQLDSLENCLEYRSLRSTLISLPKNLDETYARILYGIPEQHKQNAIRILQFLAYSERPLDIEEVIDIIAVDTEGDEHFDAKYRLPDRDEILCYCSSLVVAMSVETSLWGKRFSSVELQLAHFSVKEYLTSNRLDNDFAQIFQEHVARGSIATVCLGYLLSLDYSVLAQMAPLSKVWELEKKYPLTHYCVRYWMAFAAVAESRDERLQSFIRRFFDRNQKSSYTKLYFLYYPDGQRKMLVGMQSEVDSPLFYASYGGLLNTAKDLLSCGANIEASERIISLTSAAYVAGDKGHKEIWDLLIRQLSTT